MNLEKSSPCRGCGARSYDPGRFHAVYGLCVYCFAEPHTLQQAADDWRASQPVDCRPADTPTDHIPGTKAKADRLAWRLANSLQLHHPDDATYETHDWPDDDPDDWQPDDSAFEWEHANKIAGVEGKIFGETESVSPKNLQEYANWSKIDHHRKKTQKGETSVVIPSADPEQLEACPGVERDTSRRVIRWRARPIWRGCRVNLGTFEARPEAVAAVLAYFADRLSVSMFASWPEAEAALRRWLANRRRKARAPRAGKPDAWRPAAGERASRTCAAVVETMRGWHDIEWPAGYPFAVAKRAARKLDDSYRDAKTADRDYRKRLAEEAEKARRRAEARGRKGSDEQEKE